ncbi:MAG: helix-turn-helix domain-containing protein [Pseudomonadota bacterium]
MLTRGKLANQTGCNAETIRYYEKTGLIPQPERSASGYRSYSAEHVRLLHFIQRAKTLGFSTEQIRSLIELNLAGEEHTRAEVKSLTQDHIDGISQKISDLKKIRKRLQQISAYCDGSSASAKGCPILSTLFAD